jgi:hypothetical protein
VVDGQARQWEIDGMQLDDLIGQVEGDDPLDRISSAMAVKAGLDELGDELIDHFVDAARKAGRSWSEIGTAMGVTKQAAQQRHTGDRHRRRHGGGLFTRFTDDAREAVRAANDEADALGHTFIGTEHLLLGVMAMEGSAGAKVLAALGVGRDDVLAAVSRAEERFEPRYRKRRRPFTPMARKVLELGLREALALNSPFVGTEHLVLGIHREKRCIGFKAMDAKGVTRDALVAEIKRVREAA